MNEELKNIIEVDRTIHEPARLMIVAILSAVKEADFLYLLKTSGLTKGNLSSHLSRLEDAGFIEIEKTFVGKSPHTVCRLTESGREAMAGYKRQMRAVL